MVKEFIYSVYNWLKHGERIFTFCSNRPKNDCRWSNLPQRCIIINVKLLKLMTVRTSTTKASRDRSMSSTMKNAIAWVDKYNQPKKQQALFG